MVTDEQTDEESLRKLSIVVADILRFEQMMKQLFESAIGPKLAKISSGLAEADNEVDSPESRLRLLATLQK